MRGGSPDVEVVFGRLLVITVELADHPTALGDGSNPTSPATCWPGVSKAIIGLPKPEPIIK